MIYEKETDPSLGVLLDKLAPLAARPGAGWGPFEAANVRDAARDFQRTTVLPKSLVQRSAALSSEAYHVWVEARKRKDWALFAPKLEEWLALLREKAALIDASRPAYDVLLDDYERGTTSARLGEVFEQMKAGVAPLLRRVREAAAAEAAAEAPPRDAFLRGRFDEKIQAELCRSLAVEIGFDLERGRLDVSVHPFTGGAAPDDTRMTTRFKDDDIIEGISGVIHETGHALYEQSRNADQDGLPVNKVRRRGIRRRRGTRHRSWLGSSAF